MEAGSGRSVMSGEFGSRIAVRGTPRPVGVGRRVGTMEMIGDPLGPVTPTRRDVSDPDAADSPWACRRLPRRRSRRGGAAAVERQSR